MLILAQRLLLLMYRTGIYRCDLEGNNIDHLTPNFKSVRSPLVFRLVVAISPLSSLD